MTISPGWYPDPADRSTQRYWDGSGWVGAAIPADVSPPAGPVVVPAATAQPTYQSAELPAKPHGLPLAAPSARFVARLIDTAILIGLNILVNGWFAYLWIKAFIPFYQQYMNRAFSGQSLDGLKAPDQLNWLTFVMLLISVALWWAYEVPAIAYRGQTPGKRLTGIKVVRVENLEPLGFSRSWRRWNVLGLPSLLFLCIGPCFVFLQAADVVFILVDRVRRMALHDRSAATFVVQLPKMTEKNR